jgi:hypothetical protein
MQGRINILGFLGMSGFARCQHPDNNRSWGVKAHVNGDTSPRWCPIGEEENELEGGEGIEEVPEASDLCEG